MAFIRSCKTYSSYSGVDIRVVINGEPVGSMQVFLCYSAREGSHLCHGFSHPISYSRGKRGIAGTMISLLLDKHFIYSDNFKNEKAYLDKDELFEGAVRGGQGDSPVGSAEEERNLRNLTGGANLQTVGEQQLNVDQYGQRQDTEFRANDVAQNYQIAQVFYVDQILPFDVSIGAANEYGKLRLYGCEILNEGSASRLTTWSSRIR